MAACFLFVAVFFISESYQVASVWLEDDPGESELFSSIGNTEYERFASVTEDKIQSHASFVSHMRLLGLRPEHTPEDKELKSVEFADYQPEPASGNRAELFRELEKVRAFPEIPILSEHRSVRRPRTSFGSDFSVSLVSY